MINTDVTDLNQSQIFGQSFSKPSKPVAKQTDVCLLDENYRKFKGQSSSTDYRYKKTRINKML